MGDEPQKIPRSVIAQQSLRRPGGPTCSREFPTGNKHWRFRSVVCKILPKFAQEFALFKVNPYQDIDAQPQIHNKSIQGHCWRKPQNEQTECIEWMPDKAIQSIDDESLG
jgi:hypothetical protein